MIGENKGLEAIEQTLTRIDRPSCGRISKRQAYFGVGLFGRHPESRPHQHHPGFRERFATRELITDAGRIAEPSFKEEGDVSSELNRQSPSRRGAYTPAPQLEQSLDGCGGVGGPTTQP